MKFEITEQDKAALCRQAPEFSGAVRTIELDGFECYDDLFHALVQSVISQQLSGRVAAAIGERVEKLLGTITAEKLSAAEYDDLRGCGLSGRKIEYLKGAAGAVLEGKIDFAKVAALSDAEVIAELVQLKGIGVWTAEMLLIFALARKDILSYKDLGIRNGIMVLNKLDQLTEADFEFYRKRYSPYGTLASLYLWRIKDGAV